MKRIVLTLVVLAVAGLCFASSPEFVKVYESGFGNVSFNHTTHSQLSECKECHVETDMIIVSDKKTAHDFCKACHINTDNAPTKCKGCHIK